MKKILILLIAIFGLGISSCEEERIDNESNSEYMDQRLRTFNDKLVTLEKKINILEASNQGDEEVTALLKAQKLEIANIVETLKNVATTAQLSELTIKYMLLQSSFEKSLADIEALQTLPKDVEALKTLLKYYPNQNDLLALVGVGTALQKAMFSDLASFILSYADTKKKLDDLQNAFNTSNIGSSDMNMLMISISAIDRRLGDVIQGIIDMDMDQKFVQSIYKAIQDESLALFAKYFIGNIDIIKSNYLESQYHSNDEAGTDYGNKEGGMMYHNIHFFSKINYPTHVFGQSGASDVIKFSDFGSLMYTGPKELYIQVTPSTASIAGYTFNLTDTQGNIVEEVTVTCEKLTTPLTRGDANVYKLVLSTDKSASPCTLR